MSQPAIHLDILPARVSCLMLPLADRMLLVPSTAVAEVLVGEEAPSAGDKALCYGWVHWRQQRIPLIALEVALGGQRQELATPYRMAVLNVVAAATPLGFYAVRLDGLPQSLAVTAQTVLVPTDAAAGGLLMESVVGDQRAWVPALAEIEAKVAAQISGQ